MSERELTLTTVYHPEHMEGGWQRVDHPTVAPFQDGAPDLGWEGDSRLVVYLCLPTQQFVLWRLEHDGEYRPVATLPSGASITPGNVNSVIERLIAADTRRGADAYTKIMKSIDDYERAQEVDRQAWLGDVADHLLWGLANSHLPGIDITRPRQLLSRR